MGGGGGGGGIKFFIIVLTTLFDNTHILAKIFSADSKIVLFLCKLCLQTAKRVYKKALSLGPVPDP